MDNPRIALALYKGNRSGKWYSPSVLQARLGDWLIRKFTRSPYSHCEIAVDKGNGQYDCYSASLRDGGVRMKTMPLPADKWDLIPINQPDAYIDVLNYFAQTRGKPYDFIGACGVILGIKGSLKAAPHNALKIENPVKQRGMLKKYGRNKGAIATHPCPLAKADSACISRRSPRGRADCKRKHRNLHNEHEHKRENRKPINRIALSILPSQAGRNRRQISPCRKVPTLQAI